MGMVGPCPCHTLVMPTVQMSWEPKTAVAACEKPLHLQKPNPSVKAAKD